jgi:hypothetical protein
MEREVNFQTADLVTAKKFHQLTGLSLPQLQRFFADGTLTRYKCGTHLNLVRISEWEEKFGSLSKVGKAPVRYINYTGRRGESRQESTKAQVSKKKSKKVIA